MEGTLLEDKHGVSDSAPLKLADNYWGSTETKWEGIKSKEKETLKLEDKDRGRGPRMEEKAAA